MSVISITITPSTIQVIPGIPETVALTTSEPATIFYTLDGTNPNTIFAPVYVAPIILPQNLLTIRLNIYATNGSDSSAIITQVYTADEAEIITEVGDRLPHATVEFPCCDNSQNGQPNSLYPFGNPFPFFPPKYGPVGDPEKTVYNPEFPATAEGFDAQGNPAGFVNNPDSAFLFDQIYSTTDYDGVVYPGVGNLPATTDVIGKQTPIEYQPEESHGYDKIFHPRALVTYLDTATNDPLTPTIIMREHFALEDTEIVRDGNLLYNRGVDSPTTTGQYLRSFINQNKGTITHYYYDNSVGRWIIMSSPYAPTKPDAGNLSGMLPGRDTGTAGRVFQWLLFYYRTLI
jgi:hypothetical protein